MATTLRAIVSTGSVAGGATAVVNHTLNIDDRGVIPDEISFDVAGFQVVAGSATATQVTVRNNGPTGSANMLAENWYTPERAFGASATTGLVPRPFAPASGGSAVANSFPITARDDGASFDVFVNGTSGNNANDGLTPATALQTIAEVRRKFPFYLFGNGTRCIVHLLNDSLVAKQIYTESGLHLGGGDVGTDQSYVYRAPQMIPAPDLATGPTTAAMDGNPTRVDAAGNVSGTGRRTRFNFVGAAPGWTIGDLVGSFMRATRGGVLVTFEFPIAENGADFFIIDSHIESTKILQADTVEIVTPSIRVNGTLNADGESILTLWGKGVGFSQEIYSAPNDNNQPNTFERIEFGTVESTGVHGLTFDRCRFSGEFGARFLAGSVVFNNTASNVEVQLGGHSGFQNFMRADDPGVSPINGDFFNSGHVNLTLATRAGGFTQNGLSIGRCRTTQVIAPSSFLFERNVSIYGSTNSGVNAYAGSCVAFAIGLLGGSNSVAGVRAHQNSTVYFYTSVGNLPIRVTVTGTTGALKVGNGAAIAYGAGAGQFSEAAGYNNNFTRKNDGTAAAPVGDASLIALDTTGGV